jgi:hypothetical protein
LSTSISPLQSLNGSSQRPDDGIFWRLLDF